MECTECKKKGLTYAHFAFSPNDQICSQCFDLMSKKKKTSGIKKPLSPRPLPYRRRSIVREHLVPPPPPLDACYGDIAKDQELVSLWERGGRSRGRTIHGPSVKGPTFRDPKSGRRIKLVDPAFPETLKPYEDKWKSEAPQDPLAEFEKRILDPKGLVLTARELILVMDFERRNWLELNTFYWVPYNFRDWLALAKLLVKYEYVSVLDGDDIRLLLASVLLEILQEVARLSKPLTSPSLAAKAITALSPESIKRLKKDRATYHLFILGILSAQCKNELKRLKEDVWLSIGGPQGLAPKSIAPDFKKDALDFWRLYAMPKTKVDSKLPPHLRCDVGKWYWSEKGYQVGSFLKSSGAFVVATMKALGAIAEKASKISTGVSNPVSVVLAPVAIVFEGKHLKNNAINKAAIIQMIEGLKKTGKVESKDLEKQMLEDAFLFRNPKKFAFKYGGKIDYALVQRNIKELEKRLSAINKGSAIRWFKIAGAALGGACAGAAIVVTGGVAAIVIMGVGIAAAVATTAVTAKDIYDWTQEYDERWKLAHTLLEGARQEAVYLKFKVVGDTIEYAPPDKQLVPHPTITMLVNMGLFQEPGDALFLQFSDAFIYQQVMLAMALGNSAVADKRDPKGG